MGVSYEDMPRRRRFPTDEEYNLYCAKCKNDLFGECDLMKNCVQMGFSLFEKEK